MTVTVFGCVILISIDFDDDFIACLSLKFQFWLRMYIKQIKQTRETVFDHFKTPQVHQKNSTLFSNNEVWRSGRKRSKLQLFSRRLSQNLNCVNWSSSIQWNNRFLDSPRKTTDMSCIDFKKTWLLVKLCWGSVIPYPRRIWSTNKFLFIVRCRRKTT